MYTTFHGDWCAKMGPIFIIVLNICKKFTFCSNQGYATSFKECYRNHKTSFRHQNKINKTELSNVAVIYTQALINQSHFDHGLSP